MNWEIRPATLGDARYVWLMLWPRGREEMAGFGVDHAKWRSACAQMIEQDQCIAYVHNSAPVAILGVLDGQTWFQATAEGEELLPSLTRTLRRSIDELARSHGMSDVELHSLCVDQHAAKWFEFLGFKEDREFLGETLGGHRERKFVKHWN